MEYVIFDRKDNIAMSWIYNYVSPNKLKFLHGNSYTYEHRMALSRNFQDNSNSNLIELRS